MNERKAAKGLGWFSIALGLTQVIAPRWLGRRIGIGDQPTLMRALGVREMLTGVGILSQHRPAPGLLWGRVAGDVMDMALLGKALNDRDMTRPRIAIAAGMVAAVGAIDLVVARQLQE